MTTTAAKFKCLLAAILCTGFIASACSNGEEDYGPDQAEQPEPEPIGNERPLPPPTAINCPNGTYLTWNNFGAAFLGNYCTSCHHSDLPEDQRHGAPPEANFETAYLAQVWRAAILMKASGEAANMPPAQEVPAQERRELSEWLNCGAPEK